MGFASATDNTTPSVTVITLCLRCGGAFYTQQRPAKSVPTVCGWCKAKAEIKARANEAIEADYGAGDAD